ncbi:co-regulatory protein PtrA N-terminal domain-containing protein [Pseudomonas putida]
MNSIKALVMVITFGMAGLALAEGGGDRTFAKMEAARQTATDAYQLAQQKTDPAPHGKPEP